MRGVAPPPSAASAARSWTCELQLPAEDRATQRAEALGIEHELVPGNPVDAGQPLGQHGSIEAGVLRGSKFAESIETEDGFQRGLVDEVAGVGSAEQDQQRVGGELHKESTGPIALGSAGSNR